MGIIRRGDVVWADFDPAIDTEIRKKRPSVVVSNNIANRILSGVTVVPLTTKKLDRLAPIHVIVPKGTSGLPQESKALVEQIRSLSKARLFDIIGCADKRTMKSISRAIRIHLSL